MSSAPPTPEETKADGMVAKPAGKLELSEAQRKAIEREIQRQIQSFNKKRSSSDSTPTVDTEELASYESEHFSASFAAEDTASPRRATLIDKIKHIGHHRRGRKESHGAIHADGAKTPKTAADKGEPAAAPARKGKHRKGVGSYVSADLTSANELKEAKGVKDLAAFAKDISTIGNRKLLYGKPLSRLPIVSLPHPFEKDKTIAVPEYMHSMICLIRERELIKRTGIFRLSGSKVELDEFKKTFEMGMEASIGEMMKKFDPNTITDLFKYFWRELPDPLFPPTLFWDLVNAWKESPPNYEKLREIRDRGLPESRRWVAWYLLDFLAEVSTYQRENMMTPSNVAIVFAPNIIKARPETIQIIMETTQPVIELTSFFVEDALKSYIQRHPECRSRLGLEQEDEVEASVMIQTKEADQILEHEPDNAFSDDEFDAAQQVSSVGDELGPPTSN
eukprot:TRINITY_DN7353_c0_g1_i3.p1 TRINITY_DN7353_c0_g1~~TRINITY_DN7353_c0_g1_i3.p1  ORF type:complete len:449 (-),score=108.68 TRINITY_DN7353_c0_g1_i3:145-1491(-)